MYTDVALSNAVLVFVDMLILQKGNMTEVWNVNIDLDYNLYSNVTYKNTTGWNPSEWLLFLFLCSYIFDDIFPPFLYYYRGQFINYLSI